MLEVAFIIGLQPEEFWRLTLKEFQLAVKAFKYRDEAMWNKIAQHASWVTAPHLKKPISAKKLLGTQNRGKKEKTNPEKTKRILAELEEEFNMHSS